MIGEMQELIMKTLAKGMHPDDLEKIHPNLNEDG